MCWRSTITVGEVGLDGAGYFHTRSHPCCALTCHSVPYRWDVFVSELSKLDLRKVRKIFLSIDLFERLTHTNTHTHRAHTPYPPNVCSGQSSAEAANSDHRLNPSHMVGGRNPSAWSITTPAQGFPGMKLESGAWSRNWPKALQGGICASWYAALSLTMTSERARKLRSQQNCWASLFSLSSRPS